MQRITNNPGNIRYSPYNQWVGQIGKHKGFAVFDEEYNGIRALIRLLHRYLQMGHNTIKAIISRYAPPSENNTDAYISYVTGKLGIRDSDRIAFEDEQTIIELAQAICNMETGQRYDLDYITECFEYATKKSRTKKLPEFLPTELYSDIYTLDASGSEVSVIDLNNVKLP